MLERQELTEEETAAWERLREAEEELAAAKVAVMEATNRATRRRNPRHLGIAPAQG